jgi:hypothetical protein
MSAPLARTLRQLVAGSAMRPPCVDFERAKGGKAVTKASKKGGERGGALARLARTRSRHRRDGRSGERLPYRRSHVRAFVYVATCDHIWRRSSAMRRFPELLDGNRWPALPSVARTPSGARCAT